MSLEHDITYKFSTPGTTTPLQVVRQIFGSVGGYLDVQIAAAGQNIPNAFSLNLSKVLSIFLMVDQAVTLRAGGVNAIQQVAVTGTPTGGSFTLTYAGQTATIPYNATATQVATLLNALSSVGPNGCTTTGGPLPGTPVNVTFVGVLGLQVLATPTINYSGLTGGTSPTATVTTTTAGVAPDTTLAISAGVPLVWDSVGYYAQPFAANIATLSFTNTNAAPANAKLRTLSTS